MKNFLLLIAIALCLFSFGCKEDNAPDKEDSEVETPKIETPGEQTPEEQMPEVEISKCDDCPCPEWVEKEFKYYAEQTPVSFMPMFYYMEKDGTLYYAINNAYSSCMTCMLRFFEADGTEIEKDSEYHAPLTVLFSEGKFQHSFPCTKKYLEKY
jgi:hypothetical protein